MWPGWLKPHNFISSFHGNREKRELFILCELEDLELKGKEINLQIAASRVLYLSVQFGARAEEF